MELSLNIKYFRIALYMMREEIHKSPLDSGDPVQHSHDFFVISSCKLQARNYYYYFFFLTSGRLLLILTFQLLEGSYYFYDYSIQYVN